MRKVLKTIISKSRILKPLKHFNQNKLIIFNYHRIQDNDKESNFDESLFGPSADRFKEEVELIKKETRILSEEELINIMYDNKPIKEMCSLITFDDGYRDNYDIAFPILKDLKIPAIFFIPTLNISERKVGWWDVIAYLFKNTSKRQFFFQGREFEITNPKAIISFFISEIKCIQSNKVEDYIKDLAYSLNCSLPSHELQSSELMTWDQIKILSDNGMTIGSHSHDHSILSKQDNNTLRKQLIKSIDILESVLDKDINSIAYPVGGYEHFNSDTMDITKEIGFKLGFSYLTGINTWGKINPFDVKRMNVQREWVNLDLPLAFPNLFLKNQFKQ